MDYKVTYRHCVGCKLLKVPHYEPNAKNCVDCREKNRLKQKAAKERKALRERLYMEQTRASKLKDAMESAYGWLSSDVEGSSDNYDRIFSTNAAIARPLASSSSSNTPSFTKPAVKARVPSPVYVPLLSELGPAKKAKAVEMTRKALEKHIASINSTVPSYDELSYEEVGQEFNTADQLYKAITHRALKSSNAGKLLRFHGSYAIVADKNVDHRKRMYMALDSLRKVAGVYIDTSKLVASHVDETGHAAAFNCECPPPTATSSSTGTSNTRISQYFKESSSQSSRVPKPAARSCGGTITIEASDDCGHPLIAGQRIMILIEHPSPVQTQPV